MARLSSEDMQSRLKEMQIIDPIPKRRTRSTHSTHFQGNSNKNPVKLPALKTGASMIPDLNKLIERVRQFPDDRFIYLTYMLSENSEYFTPYSLKEVSYADLPNKHRYFTMSRNGVTYWHLSENFFTPLTQWQQGFQQYLSIIKIPTFAIFRLWKGFKVWEKTIKWKKINEARKYLEEHLFIANPIIAETVLSLRTEIVKLNRLNFVTVTMIEDWHPFYFLELHMRNFEQIRETLIEFHTNFQDKIMSTCVKAIKQQGFFPDDEINYFPSIKKMREAMSFIDRAKKRNFCKLLSNFLSYCDHLMYGMLHLITTNSFRDLARALWAHDSVGPSIEMLETNNALDEQIETPRMPESPQNPFFLAALQLLPDRIEVEPQKDILNVIFTRITNLILETVSELKNFTDDKMFTLFTEPSIMGRQEERLAGEAPDLKFRLRTDTEFLFNRKVIFAYIHNAYEKAAIYVKRFEKIRINYEIDMATNPETIRAERDLDALRAYCERYCNNVRALDGILSEVNLGLLKLAQNSLKETVTPVCVSLQTVLALYLPKLGRKEVESITTETNELLRQVMVQPETTLEIVDHIRYLDQVEDEFVRLLKNVDYAHDLYMIIKDFEIPVDDADKEDYLDCEDKLNRAVDTLNETLAKRNKFINKLNERMQEDIASINEEVRELAGLIQDPNLLKLESNPESVMKTMEELLERLNRCQERANEYLGYQKEFKLDITRYTELEEAFSELRLRMSLWNSVQEWNSALDEWQQTEFNTLNIEDMTNLNAKIMKNCLQFAKYLPPNNIVPALRKSAEDFKQKLPVLGYLRNPNLKPRHWGQIENILQAKFYNEPNIFIENYDAAGAFEDEKMEQLMEISSQATGESQLDNMLKGVENIWKETELSIVTHHDKKDVFILAGTEELQVILDDATVTVNTIAASKFVGPVKSKVDEWVEALDQFSKTLEIWQDCQLTWIYLEAIFSSPDIQRQLPNEAKMFMQVDKSFKDLMRSAKKTSLALPVMSNVDNYNVLVENVRLLDLISRGLEAYLEVKRVVFPRFYFLSNDELLEILAQTRVPQAVQPHLRKCFDAIYRLEFGQKDDGGKIVPTNDIIAFISPEGEKLLFGKGLKARGAVEEWLSKVEEAMFIAVKRYMRFGYQCYPAKEREDWFQDHPNQVVLTISQQQWAADIHAILDAPKAPKEQILANMLDYEKKCFKNLAALAALTRKDIPALLRKILCALITIDVHAKDSVSLLIEHKVYKSSDFDWLKMLRFYWANETETIYTRMASANIPYYYEYIGAGGVLVLTPLTDRCYLCLMGALQMDLGGAPAGPAGTGKTETTKDLAKAVAKQCVVFNCSDGLDYKMMGRFFSGLAQCGAWCCFDEFNRIDIEVLSVIAQQLITIRNAKVMNAKRFIFEGREIKLKKSCAVFITMNPGYAGRTELPDNLKALFRPISMMVPDYALISEVILYSEGFENPKILAHKMVQMYKLCSEQLSQQNHYDFGMRAVKSVLVMAGALKRSAPDQREDVTLIAALRDSNIPKFLADDAQLFRGILSDLFPGVELPESSHPQLEEALIIGLQEKNLQTVQTTLRKCIQLYETMCVRWGVMCVGPTGGGKSTVLNALAFALAYLHEHEVKGDYFRPVNIQTMNPKAVTMNELYGYVDPKTFEWQDGLLGLAVRNAVSVEEEIHQWIVNDGPVDAVWIENLNTVLDDNKMLCLANSERIKLTPWVHMIFEVMDLAVASPATVSRCGMVFVDPEDLGWRPLVDTWKTGPLTKLLKPELLQYLDGLFTKYFQVLLKAALNHGSFLIHQVTSSKVMVCCELLYTLSEKLEKRTVPTDQEKSIVSKMFGWAVIWSLAANFKDEEKLKYDQLLKDIYGTNQHMSFPEKGTLWDYWIDMETFNWQHWDTLLDEFVYNPELKYFDLQVPTVDTTKYGYITQMLFKRKFPVMFTGETGVGKSVLAVSTLKKLNEFNIVSVLLNFSAQTGSQRTQEMVEAPLEKRKRTQLGAPIGKNVIIFIDDVNMPKLETYGAQPPIELLRQFLDFSGFYDREKLFWKEILDVTLGCACAPPGGGRNPLTPRFVRHFALFSLPKPSNETLTTIFAGILCGFLDLFSSAIRPLAIPIVNASVETYMRISNELLPTPDKSHYIFNLRDLSKCIQGILQASTLHYIADMQILRLFYHETTRVFHDRLINSEDKMLFTNILNEVCVKHFNKQVVKPEEPPILFGDFMIFGRARADRIYDEIPDHRKLESVLMDYIEDYKAVTGKNMRLILFQDAIEHTVRLARLLRSDRGNGLLVGIAGMGKQSLTKLAAHVNEYKCMQIELRRNYDLIAFHEDLRIIYAMAGIQNLPVVFLIVDTQIVEEEFLEDINNILNSGEVPNLFEGDDYEKVILEAREGCNELHKEGGCTRENIFKYFINNVRNNLHLVISMSPVGDAFRRRCRMFPSLVNCTTIDWFSNWPTEALYSVALGVLQDIAKTDQERESLASTTVFMHKTVEDASIRFYKEMKRYYYTTPSSYLELLKLYQKLLQSKTEDIISKRKRIMNGLNKILSTNDLVAVMQRELEIMVPQLDEQSTTMKKLVDRLQVETNQADEVKAAVLKDEGVAKEKAGVAQAISDDASKDLEIAMPALRDAEEALNSITKSDINELKSFTTPPALVQFCMEAVCILMGSKPTWAAAKGLMADVNFIKRLFEYDKEHIKEDTLKKLKKYIDHKDFVPAKFEKVSKVAKSVSMWVIAMDKFAKVYKVVEPKIKRKEAAEAELTDVMNVLRAKQRELAAVEAKIQSLKEDLKEKEREFQVVQDSVDLTYGRINRAGRLTSALADEEVRWKETVKTLTYELACVPGDVLVSAACVAYLGAFTTDFRNELSAEWVKKCAEKNIPSSNEFNLLKVLGDPYEMRSWTMDGLPKDAISIENGIYATRALRWPLMIDPQEQANRWIRNMESKNNLHVLKMTDGNLLRSLENCIRQGYTVLLEDVLETVDPSLTPILQRETYKFEGIVYLKLGDTVIEYNQNFKLYMTTKLANPHYLPEICINVTLVNFQVTESGLEDQLLADIVAIELPAMEIQRNDLVVKINADKQQLLALEDKVLRLLFHSTGNILDDEELVETLNDAKETSQIIATRLIDTEETEKVITATREEYRSLASRGAILYFVVAGLAEVDPMYQYSLKYFSSVFCNVIKQPHEKVTLPERISQLMEAELKTIYDNVSRGLFENHKLIFSFLLALAIEKQEGRVHMLEVNFLTRGVVTSVEQRAMPQAVKLNTEDWKKCIYLEDNFPEFKGLCSQIATPFYLSIMNHKEVFNFSNSKANPVDTWDKKLNNFYKLMFVCAFRKESFLINVVSYIQSTIGKYFTETHVGGNPLKVVFNDTTNVTPMVFVLSQGSDPMAGFLKFTEEMQYMDKLYSISLGQGQGPIAESLIEKSLRLGHWVFLQNCHLATSWMPQMETIVRNMTLGLTKAHVDFRLFLSSMPTRAFPISVLQNSVKLTNEPPKGIKANVLGALADLDKDFFEKHVLEHDWRAIVFGLCMFHAVLLERRKFGPLGWNILYEFNESDRTCGLKILDFFINRKKADDIPWEAIFYINAEITWGGRVTDYWDQRCLRTILKIFSSEKILNAEYKYCRGDSYYRDPRTKTVVEYQEYVQNFPVMEDPEIFGMNKNANIVFQTKETEFFIATLLMGQPRAAADAGQAQENDMCLEIIERIQQVIIKSIRKEDVNSSLLQLDDKGQMPSLTTVLLQEIDRYNAFLKLIHESLVNLKKAIKGLVVMSESLEEVFQSLIKNLVPNLWSKKSFLSIKPLPAYIADFQRRIDFIYNWAREGPQQSYWISGFFFPQSFLTGLLQTHARKRVLPIDSLKIDFQVLDRVLVQQDFFELHQEKKSDAHLYGDMPQSTEAGVNVHGFFIEAAHWDASKGGLIDALPGELYFRMPAIRFVPCLSVQAGQRYEAPCYKTQQRSGVLSTTGHSTNFVVSVLLESKLPPDFWILRGTALVSAVSDNIS